MMRLLINISGRNSLSFLTNIIKKWKIPEIKKWYRFLWRLWSIWLKRKIIKNQRKLAKMLRWVTIWYATLSSYAHQTHFWTYFRKMINWLRFQSRRDYRYQLFICTKIAKRSFRELESITLFTQCLNTWIRSSLQASCSFRVK